MAWVHEVTNEFGRMIGIPDLQLNEQNKLRLQIDNETILTFFYAENLPIPEVIISRAVPAQHVSTEQLEKALRANHFEMSSGAVLQCALDDKHFIYSARMPERSFNLSSLENSINFLNQVETKLLK